MKAWVRGAIGCCVIMMATTLIAQPVDPYADDYRYYKEFYTQLKQGNEQKAQELYDQMQSVGAEAFIKLSMRSDWADYYLEKGEYDEARRHATTLLTYNPIIQQRNMRVLLEEALARGDISQTVKWYGRLLSTFKDADPTGELLERIQKQYRTRIDLFDALRTPEERLNYLRHLMSLQLYSKVPALTKKMLPELKLRKHKAEVHFLKGLMHYNQFQFALALPEFRKALAMSQYNYTEMYKISYFLAKTFRELNQPTLAKQTYESALTIKHKSILEDEVLYHLTKLYQFTGRLVQYSESLQRMKRRFIGSWFYKQLLWEEKLDDLLESGQTADISSIVPEEKTRARLSQFYRRNGGFKRNPLNFETYQYAKAIFEEEELPNPKASRYQWLRENGLVKRMEEEIYFRRYKEKKMNIHDQEILCDIMGRRGQYYAMIDEASNTIQRAKRGEVKITKSLLRAMYPRLYWNLTQKYAKKYNVDPYLLLAIMREESQFLARSRGDFQTSGLMRLPEKHGREFAWLVGTRWEGKQQLLEPESNIRYGAFYLSVLMKRYKNNKYMALAELHVDREVAMRFREMKLKDDYFEAIERANTPQLRDYFRRVNDSYLMYNLLY
jgi:soluble lytic murein transglycosylase